jgi:hypothetical protein
MSPLLISDRGRAFSAISRVFRKGARMLVTDLRRDLSEDVSQFIQDFIESPAINRIHYVSQGGIPERGSGGYPRKNSILQCSGHRSPVWPGGNC